MQILFIPYSLLQVQLHKLLAANLKLRGHNVSFVNVSKYLTYRTDHEREIYRKNLGTAEYVLDTRFRFKRQRFFKVRRSSANVLRMSTPDCVVVGLDSDPEQRAVINICHRLQIPTILIQDGAWIFRNGVRAWHSIIYSAIRQTASGIVKGNPKKACVDKADEIIDNLDTITISVFERDEEGDKQYELVKKFLEIKGAKKPNVIFRCLGKVDTERWKKLDGIIATRILHNPLGSFKYSKNPTVPESGICLEILNRMAIDRFGKVSICVRFDPKCLRVIGDAAVDPLLDVWNGPKRKEWVKYHIEGKRDRIPMCSYCDFWGVPTGHDSNKISLRDKVWQGS